MSDMTEAPQKAAVRSDAFQTANLDLLAGVSLRVSVEVGSTSISLAEVMNLGEGSVLELDRQANDPLDIFANGTLIARGEVVTVDGRYGIRVTEVVSAEPSGTRIERRA